MLPVLFSIGSFSVSSFGVFLVLGILLGLFLVWRLARAWELDEEKILDLTFLTIIGGLIGARIYYVIENINLFSSNFASTIQINKLPGFSFWGGVLGGWLTLYFFARRKRLNFWLIADIASVGFLSSLVLTNLGCFFGGCNIGIKGDFLAINIVGILGKRLPVQLLEAALLLLAVSNIWSKAVHFHPRGKILSLSLIYLGLVKLLTQPLKENHNQEIVLSLVLISLGIGGYYKFNKRNIIVDLKKVYVSFIKLLTDPVTRRIFFDRLKKYWYNLSALISWKIRNFKKSLGRLHVKFSYKNN